MQALNDENCVRWDACLSKRYLAKLQDTQRICSNFIERTFSSIIFMLERLCY